MQVSVDTFSDDRTRIESSQEVIVKGDEESTEPRESVEVAETSAESEVEKNEAELGSQLQEFDPSSAQ